MMPFCIDKITNFHWKFNRLQSLEFSMEWEHFQTSIFAEFLEPQIEMFRSRGYLTLINTNEMVARLKKKNKKTL